MKKENLEIEQARMRGQSTVNELRKLQTLVMSVVEELQKLRQDVNMLAQQMPAKTQQLVSEPLKPLPGLPERLLTPRETAKELGVGLATLRGWRRDGTGPAEIRLTGRTIRYLEESIRKFLVTRQNSRH